MIEDKLILAGHDISAGGLITALLEMNFANIEGGLSVSLDALHENDLIKILFSENPGILIQSAQVDEIENRLKALGVNYAIIGEPIKERKLNINHLEADYSFDSIKEINDEDFLKKIFKN